MPLIGIIIGGIDFTSLSLRINDATINYGIFIQSVIDFLIIAACIFLITKIINKLEKKKEEPKEEKKKEEIVILEEIRDLLKKETKKDK